jgi:hypothetical protein
MMLLYRGLIDQTWRRLPITIYKCTRKVKPSRYSHLSSLTRSIEKSQMLREAEQEYKDLLKQLEEDDNVTREEIENFKKNALIHKSVLEVRRRA